MQEEKSGKGDEKNFEVTSIAAEKRMIGPRNERRKEKVIKGSGKKRPAQEPKKIRKGTSSPWAEKQGHQTSNSGESAKERKMSPLKLI